MRDETVRKLNTVGALLRFTTPLLVGIILFLLSQGMTEIRELRDCLWEMKNEIVYKCDYIEDQKTIRAWLDKLENRVYNGKGIN